MSFSIYLLVSVSFLGVGLHVAGLIDAHQALSSLRDAGINSGRELVAKMWRFNESVRLLVMLSFGSIAIAMDDVGRRIEGYEIAVTIVALTLVFCSALLAAAAYRDRRARSRLLGLGLQRAAGITKDVDAFDAETTQTTERTHETTMVSEELADIRRQV